MMEMNKIFRFPIGTKYYSSGKIKRVYTVIDQWTTTNISREIVQKRYVSTSYFLGQKITTYDVLDTTIAKNLLPKFKHLLES